MLGRKSGNLVLAPPVWLCLSVCARFTLGLWEQRTCFIYLDGKEENNLPKVIHPISDRPRLWIKVCIILKLVGTVESMHFREAGNMIRGLYHLSCHLGKMPLSSLRRRRHPFPDSQCNALSLDLLQLHFPQVSSLRCSGALPYLSDDAHAPVLYSWLGSVILWHPTPPILIKPLCKGVRGVVCVFSLAGEVTLHYRIPCCHSESFLHPFPSPAFYIIWLLLWVPSVFPFICFL